MPSVHLPKPSGRLTLEFELGRGWAVFDAMGRRMTGHDLKRQRAAGRMIELQAAADARAKIGPRSCMCCHKVFDSEGIHHRLCDDCRRKRAWP